MFENIMILVIGVIVVFALVKKMFKLAVTGLIVWILIQTVVMPLLS